MIVYLDNLRLKLAHQIARFLSKTGVTPNQVTVSRLVLSIPSSIYFFSRGDYFHNLIGLALYLFSVPLDWVDGALARMMKKESALGGWLDTTFDRVLMLSVLASIFYAGVSSESSQRWSLLAIFFFSTFFFLTTLLSDFDRRFNLDFPGYQKMREEMEQGKRKPKTIDRLLINFLTVHQNSLTKFCFCISYPLFVGIIVNRLWLTFVFVALMFVVRSLGLLFIVWRAVWRGETDSELVKILRERMKNDV